MKKRNLFMLAVAVLLSATVIGCSKKNGGSSGTNTSESGSTEKVKIRYYDSTDAKLISTQVVDAFNASQNDIEVELVLIPNDDYDDKIKTLLSGGGDMVDVFYLRQLSQVLQYGDNKVSMNLSPFLKRSDTLDLSRYGSALTTVQDKDGETLALPRIKNGWFLFYNKKSFDNEGIPYPEQMTWDQYATLAAKLTKVKDDGTKQWGGYFPPWTLNLYALQYGEYLTDDDLSHTKGALEFLNRIYNVDKSHMGTAEMAATSSNPDPEFETGNVGMMINGDWTFLLLGQDEKNNPFGFDWDMAPLPVPDGVPAGTTVGGVNYIAMNAQTKHAEAAWKFMEFYSGPGGAAIFAKNYQCPAYMTDGAADEYVASTGHKSAALMFQGNTYPEEAAQIRYSEIRTLFNKDAGLYLLGEISIDDFMDQFGKQRAEILSK